MSKPAGTFHIPRGWRPLAATAVVLTIVLCAVTAYRGLSTDRGSSTLDFRDFWLTALHFRETGQIVTEFGVHNYLPFFTIFMMPWSYLPLPAAVALFTALSMAAGAASVVMTEILLNGQLDPRPRASTYLAVLLVLPYAWSAGVLGQLGLILLFLMIATWFLSVRGLEWEAGITLGFAAAIKLLPAALIIFFLLKLRWRVVSGSLATILLLAGAVPWAMLPWREFLDQHHAFVDRAVSGGGASATVYADKPQKAKYNNNGLAIVLRRLLTPTNFDPQENEPPEFTNVADLPRTAVWWIYVILLAAIVTVSIAAAARGGPRWPPADLDSARTLQAQFGVWCSVMLLCSPLVWTHYLVMLYWPLSVVCDRAERSQRSRRKIGVVAGAALLIWVISLLALAWPMGRAAGAQLAAVFVVWLACATWSLAAPLPPREARRPRQRSKQLRLTHTESETELSPISSGRAS